MVFLAVRSDDPEVGSLSTDQNFKIRVSKIEDLYTALVDAGRQRITQTDRLSRSATVSGFIRRNTSDQGVRTLPCISAQQR